MGLRTALGLKKTRQVPVSLTEAFAGKNFSSDWTSGNTPYWEEALAYLKDKPCDILEIGSFEGRSAIAFLTLLPLGRITCVDPFPGNRSEIFDGNLLDYAERVNKIISRSDRALSNLIFEKKSFDVVYIDGDHTRAGALIDSLLCWPLLKVGGTIIWDDYLWGKEFQAEQRPEQAVDWFLASHKSSLEIVARYYQIIARRIC